MVFFSIAIFLDLTNTRRRYETSKPSCTCLKRMSTTLTELNECLRQVTHMEVLEWLRTSAWKTPVPAVSSVLWRFLGKGLGSCPQFLVRNVALNGVHALQTIWIESAPFSFRNLIIFSAAVKHGGNHFENFHGWFG